MKSADELALLVTAHWGVLVHQIDQDRRWWARNAGRRVVNAIAQQMKPENPEYADALAWTRSQVELDERWMTPVSRGASDSPA
jgi:hypothetical protein